MSAEDVETACAVLERQSSSLGGLLEELLELGSSHNRVSRAAEPVLLEDAISDALETAPPPDGKTVIVRPAPTSVSVLGDRRRLARVVVNLLTNAYRYGGSRIVVGLEDRPGQAVLSVEDDGVGVNDDLVPKLFVPFTRGGGGPGPIPMGPDWASPWPGRSWRRRAAQSNTDRRSHTGHDWS